METVPLRTFVCRNVCVTMFVLALKMWMGVCNSEDNAEQLVWSECGRVIDRPRVNHTHPPPRRPEKLPLCVGSLRAVVRWAR